MVIGQRHGMLASWVPCVNGSLEVRRFKALTPPTPRLSNTSKATTPFCTDSLPQNLQQAPPPPSQTHKDYPSPMQQHNHQIIKAKFEQEEEQEEEEEEEGEEEEKNLT